MKIDVKQRNLAITILLCGAVVAYVLLVFLPTQRSIAALQSELTTQQDYITRQQQAEIALDGLQQEVIAARRFSEDWRSAAPDAGRLAPVNASISQCAAEAQVEITQLNPQPAESLARLTRVPVSLTSVGRFDAVIDFLARIEALPHTIWIEKLHLTKVEGAGDSVRCELMLVIFADNREISN